MEKQKKLVWLLGNVFLGISGFFAYRWSVVQAWGNEIFWFYPFASVSLILIGVFTFNFLLIYRDRMKHWGVGILLFLVSAGGALLANAFIENSIF